MAIKRKALRKSLVRKFKFEAISGLPHEKFVLRVDGKKSAMTYLSWGHTEIDDSILKKIANQLGVARLNQVYKMVECTIDEAAYTKLLRRS